MQSSEKNTDGTSTQSVEERVRKEEERIRQEDMGSIGARREGLKLPVILLGAAIYAFGFNVFLLPLHLYAGGMMGFAQLFRDLLSWFGLSFTSINITGILYYIMNIPAFIIALRRMRKRFIVKTIFAVTCVTVMLLVIPHPAEPILDTVLGNAMVAGLICGSGVGLILLMGACDGGVNLIAMLLISRRGKTSVGRVSIVANVILYGIMLFLFDIPTVIYSLIYAVFGSIATDKIHAQNISTQVTILTKLEDTRDMEVEVLSRLYRGMTEVDANGIFTGERVKMFIVFINKYESGRLKGIIRAHDPNAFIVETEGVRIEGNFLRKLE